MNNTIIYSYFNHPNSLCMSYYEHALHSLIISFLFYIGFINGLIHSIFPFINKTFSKNTITYVQNYLERRQHC